jgi:hypothetical protein
MHTSSDEPRDDLLELGERLRAARPQLTAAELDHVKLRVRRRVARPERKGTAFMKSRLAIMLMLVLGLMLSTTGAGLAISGVAGSDDAAGNQYCGPDSGYTPGPDSSGDDCDTTTHNCVDDNSGNDNSGNGSAEDCDKSGTKSGTKPDNADNGVLGVQKGGGNDDTSSSSPPVDTAAPQQVATSESGQLAFTGYAGILVLVLGLGLLTMGVVLRRRTRTE